MTAQKHHSKQRHKPSGKAACVPTVNIKPNKKRRQYLKRAIAKATAFVQSMRVFKELTRRRRRSDYWTHRKPNRDGIAGETALLMAILDNLDLRTWQCKKNLEQLAIQAGLRTDSLAGGESISRASRAADRLDLLGVISAPKAYFNPYDGRCECKQITVTEDFFTVLGLDLKAAKRERAKLAGEPVEEAENVTLDHPVIIAASLANYAKMMARALGRMKIKRDNARQQKAARYAHSPAPA